MVEPVEIFAKINGSNLNLARKPFEVRKSVTHGLLRSIETPFDLKTKGVFLETGEKQLLAGHPTRLPYC
jgi:hypothetical protein